MWLILLLCDLRLVLFVVGCAAVGLLFMALGLWVGIISFILFAG